MSETTSRKILLLFWLPGETRESTRKYFRSNRAGLLLDQLGWHLQSEGIDLIPFPFFPGSHAQLSLAESDWSRWLELHWYDSWYLQYWRHQPDEYWEEAKLLMRSAKFFRLLESLISQGVIDGVVILTPHHIEHVGLSDEPPEYSELRYVSDRLNARHVLHVTLGETDRRRSQQISGIRSLNYPTERREILNHLMSMRVGFERFEDKFWDEDSPAFEAADPPEIGAVEEDYDVGKEDHDWRLLEVDEHSKWASGQEQISRKLHRLEDSATTLIPQPKLSSPKAAALVTNEVRLGVAVPITLSPGENFVARFAAYVEAFKEEVRRIFKEEAPSSPPRFDLEGCRWQLGAKVTVRLHADHLEIKNPVQRFKWNGTKQILRFDAKVLREANEKTLILKFDVAVEGLPILTIRPEIAMSLPQSSQTRGPNVGLTETTAPKTAFASYTAADRREVLGRIRSLQIFTGIDVFLDNLSIRPGEMWKPVLDTEIRNRDIFWLFWSRDAKDSPWVDWEWRTALTAKSLAGIQPHPLEPADIAPPPKELSDLQFGAMYEWYITNLREPWLAHNLRLLWHRARSAFRN